MSTQLSGPASPPIGGVRVVLVNENGSQWVAFPKHSQLENAVFDVALAGRIAGDDVAIMMVEAEDHRQLLEPHQGTGRHRPEVSEGLEAAKPFIKALCEAQSDLAAARPSRPSSSRCSWTTRTTSTPPWSSAPRLGGCSSQIADKQERDTASETSTRTRVTSSLAGQFEGREARSCPQLSAPSPSRLCASASSRTRSAWSRPRPDRHREVEVLPRVHGSGNLNAATWVSPR